MVVSMHRIIDYLLAARKYCCGIDMCGLQTWGNVALLNGNLHLEGSICNVQMQDPLSTEFLVICTTVSELSAVGGFGAVGDLNFLIARSI